MLKNILSMALLTALMVTPHIGWAHEHEGQNAPAPSDEITIEKLTDTIFMIKSGGGNIIVSRGEQGLFMVDNGLADQKEKVITAVRGLYDQPVKLLVNTHWHYDHAGNNQSFGDDDTVIIAHENVRSRLEKGGKIAAFDKMIEPSALSALPVLTYKEGVKIHLNGSEADIIKMDAAHTDGDSVIFWPKENILHTGDLFFNGFFPFIDASSGGSLRGMIAGTDKLLTMVDDQTKIIPGHGPLANKSDLAHYNKMLKILAERLKNVKDANQTKAQWVVKSPLSDLNAEWGDGFLPTDKFTDIIWDAY